MKKYYFVVNTWKKSKPVSMLEVASAVTEKMDGNKNFPDPAVPLTEMGEKAARLQTTYNNRNNGKVARLELKDASEDMFETLRTQGMYVTNAAKGSNAIIETSGYTPSKETDAKSVIPDMPTDVKMESKNGNVCLIAKKPKGATSLCWIVYYGEVTAAVRVENNILTVPPSVGVQIISPGKTREVLRSLVPGTKVTVQVLAQNSAGCSALSEPVSIYVNK